MTEMNNSSADVNPLSIISALQNLSDQQSKKTNTSQRQTEDLLETAPIGLTQLVSDTALQKIYLPLVTMDRIELPKPNRLRVSSPQLGTDRRRRIMGSP